MLTPIFDGDKVIAFIGSTIHHTDIGGYGIGAGARDVHEEGLWIPPLKLYERGEPCEVLHAMIRSNVRTPDAVFGDLAAQVSSGRAASERLIGMCRRYGLPDIEQLSDEIIRRSEEATRSAIRKLKAGTFVGESKFDVPGGEIITLEGGRDDRRRTKARSPSISPAARRRPRPASTWCSTTPTPIRPSRCAAASIPICPTTPAAWRRSR